MQLPTLHFLIRWALVQQEYLNNFHLRGIDKLIQTPKFNITNELESIFVPRKLILGVPATTLTTAGAVVAVGVAVDVVVLVVAAVEAAGVVVAAAAVVVVTAVVAAEPGVFE